MKAFFVSDQVDLCVYINESDTPAIRFEFAECCVTASCQCSLWRKIINLHQRDHKPLYLLKASSLNLNRVRAAGKAPPHYSFIDLKLGDID